MVLSEFLFPQNAFHFEQRLSLPIELLDSIFGLLRRSDLVSCLFVSHHFNTVATPALYHTLVCSSTPVPSTSSASCLFDTLAPKQTLLLLRRLSHNPHLLTCIRVLDLDFSGDSIQPTKNLYMLLAKVLAKLGATGKLRSLTLEFPNTENPSFVLAEIPDRSGLRNFSTSLICDWALAKFLNGQPTLKDLTLRGSTAGRDRSAHHMLAGIFMTSPIPPPPDTSADLSLPPTEGHTNPFPLHPNSLPLLNTLRTVHSGPEIIASCARNRRLEHASIALFPYYSYDTLKALSLGIGEMKRLSIMSFDPNLEQEVLLSEVARRFPKLKALHIVILLVEYTNELLEGMGPLLEGFKSLQYITFMAARPATDSSPPPGEEQYIAKLWHQYCPTLRTIILPRGEVWFEGSSDTSNDKEIMNRRRAEDDDTLKLLGPGL